MLKKLLWYLPIIIILSCNTIKVHQQTQKTATQVPSLGTVGMVTGHTLDYSFQTYTQPGLEQGIRLELNKTFFTKKQFRAFSEQMKQQGKTHALAYSDSLEGKPFFYLFKIIDYQGLAQTINSQDNDALRESLQTNSDLRIVTAISAVIGASQEQRISQADAYYLVNNGTSRLGIALVSNNKTQHILDLENLQAFAWTDAGFCWGNDKRRRPEIKAISLGSCPAATYKNAQKLIKDNEDIGF